MKYHSDLEPIISTVYSLHKCFLENNKSHNLVIAKPLLRLQHLKIIKRIASKYKIGNTYSKG